MKKRTILSIVLTVFCLIYLGWVFYVDSTHKIQSVYWLWGKQAGLAIIYITASIGVYIDKDRSRLSKAGAVGMMLFWQVYFGYHEVSRYNSDVRLDKFGWGYNRERQKRGTPQIPPNWEIKDRTDRSVTWQAKDSTIGHQSKTIVLDSAYKIDFEDDKYELKPIEGPLSDMAIRTQYGRGKGKDSIFYYYSLGDSSRQISRYQADSIFSAKNIKKDYK
ncbi:hypothetical protein [Mucilaginibacter flavus]|uniref:hypothetical protein n=1 Tax=Mucilaginibacter flavus TaxID=931504 RepID=UPI0025B3401F|nr:hypothetical protein [Mucilaginibacter flavus]MDN3584224.1 hypothetical protein [Mucilaginibacter flavus]